MITTFWSRKFLLTLEIDQSNDGFEDCSPNFPHLVATGGYKQQKMTKNKFM